MKTNRPLPLLVAFVIAAVILFGCNLIARTPASPGSVLYTAAAETIVAQLTATVVPGTATPLPTVLFPTATLIPPLPTPTPFPTRTATAALPTQIPVNTAPPATSIPVPCNRAQFIEDVTVPDGTKYTPGVEFPKIWQVKNTGRCDWTADYRLVFVDGDRIGAPRSVKLPGKIRVGESVNLEVDMEAPDKKGTYSGEWMLEAPDGDEFGVGADGDTPLLVEIRVVNPPDLGYSYDFAANYCQASWKSGAGKLYCPTATNPQFGSITLVDHPTLENDREENEETLLTRPQDKNNGYIEGTFPGYKVKNGDYFIADVGCLKGSQGCDVTFYIDYILSDGTVKHLGTWDEEYDGDITRIHEDISFLDGQTVRFVLGVEVNSKPSKAAAFWLVPSIRAGTPHPTSTPTVTRTVVPVPTQTNPAPSPTATPTPTPTVTETSSGADTEP